MRRLDPDVVLWGRLPPPVGGVTTSVRLSAAALTAAGVRVRVADYSSVRSTVRGLLGLCNRRPVVFTASSTRGLFAFGVASLLHCRSRLRVVYIHGGAIVDQIVGSDRGRAWRWVLGRFDVVWVTNPGMVDALAQELQIGAEVVSPLPSTRFKAPDSREIASGGLRLTIAVYAGHSLYGVQFALDVKERLAELGEQTGIRVLMYGPKTPAYAMLHRQLQHRDGVVVEEQLDLDEFVQRLADSDVFLRPTTTDGDSLAVRQALQVGARVVASDLVERPPGTELATLDVEDFAQAILSLNRRVSSGDRLGEPVDVAILSVLSAKE